MYTNELNFDNMFQFKPDYSNAQWVNGRIALEKMTEESESQFKSLVLLNYETGDEEVVVTAEQRKDWSVTNWQFSPDGTKLLFMTSIFTPPQKVYRYSTHANYAVYDIKQKALKQPWGNQTIQECSWSPSGSLTWIYHGNIFVAEWDWDEFNNEKTIDLNQFMVGKDDRVRKVTSDGCLFGTQGLKTHDWSGIQNGIADWVYEEEVLPSSKAYYWSPGGNNLAFMKFDDTDVNAFPIVKHHVDQLFENGDTMVEYVSYPQPGQSNPTVNLMVLTNPFPGNNDKAVNLAFSELDKFLNLPRGYNDFLIQNVQWRNESSLYATLSSRFRKQFYI